MEQYNIAAALYKSVCASTCEQENILLSQRGPGNIKVVDFGSSCYEQQRGKSMKLNEENNVTILFIMGGEKLRHVCIVIF